MEDVFSDAELHAMDCSSDPQCTEMKTIYDEIFVEEQYTCGGYLSVSKGGTVVDVGAHVGLFALWCLHRGQAAKVVCFEPMNAQYAALAANMARAMGRSGATPTPTPTPAATEAEQGGGHEAVVVTEDVLHAPGTTGTADGVQKGAATKAAALPYPTVHTFTCPTTTDHEQQPQVVECVQSGVGALIAEAVEFTFYEKTPGNSTLKRAEKEAQLQTCMRPEFRNLWSLESHAITTLHVALSKHGIKKVDLLKIDVEGAEADVLKGLGMFDWIKIKQVVLEVHNLDGRVVELSKMLESRGFETKVVTTPDTKYTRNVLLAGRRRPLKKTAPAANLVAKVAVSGGGGGGGGSAILRAPDQRGDAVMKDVDVSAKSRKESAAASVSTGVLHITNNDNRGCDAGDDDNDDGDRKVVWLSSLIDRESFWAYNSQTSRKITRRVSPWHPLDSAVQQQEGEQEAQEVVQQEQKEEMFSYGGAPGSALHRKVNQDELETMCEFEMTTTLLVGSAGLQKSWPLRLLAPESLPPLPTCSRGWGEVARLLRQRYHNPNVYVARVSDAVGNGLFASVDLVVGTYVGEYTGVVAEDDTVGGGSCSGGGGSGGSSGRCDGYLMRYPGEGLHVSALECGSLIRFINHGGGENANVDVVPHFVDGAYHMCAVTVAAVGRGEQFLLDYGPGYWASRGNGAVDADSGV